MSVPGTADDPTPEQAPLSQRKSLAIVGGGATSEILRKAVDASRVVALCLTPTSGDENVDDGSDEGRHRLPKAFAGLHEVSEVDWVVVTADENQDVSYWLDHLVGPLTHVAVVQNDISIWERLQAWVPADRCVPVAVSVPSEHVPILRRGQSPHLSFAVGGRPQDAEFSRLFGPEIRVESVEDVDVALWKGFLEDVPRKAVANLVDLRSVEAQSPAASLVRKLLDEGQQVAVAAGVAVTDEDVGLIASEASALFADLAGSGLRWPPARSAGRRSSTEAVVDLADSLGLDVPTFRLVDTLLGVVA